MWIKLCQGFVGIKFIQGGTFVIFNIYPFYDKNLNSTEGLPRTVTFSEKSWQKMGVIYN